jgi:hypothetical protein
MLTVKPLRYIYARETKQHADIAKVPTFDEARRIAGNVAKLPDCSQPSDLSTQPPRNGPISSGVRTTGSTPMGNEYSIFICSLRGGDFQPTGESGEPKAASPAQ